MHEPPGNLSNETLRAALRDGYGLAADEITFLPLGHDSAAWVYRARTSDGSSYFLKVRLSVANEPGLLVPRYLHDQGIAHVIAPLPTATGALWTTAGDYALILYPFVAGATGMERGMSEQQWIDYGVLLRQIHAVAIPSDLARIMRRETFIPEGAGAIRRLEAYIGTRGFDDPPASALATFWRAHWEEIGTLLQRAEDLGRRWAEAARPFVLCHADAHTNNVLLDDGGQVWMVDWDETVLAPKERDLMFVMGGGIRDDFVRPRDEELVLQGYGATTVDPLGLAYYRYAWAVSDIGAYGEQVLLRPDLGPITRQASVERFESLFNPGSIVALAFAASLGAS